MGSSTGPDCGVGRWPAGNQRHDAITLDQVIFEADEEAGGSWIALPPGAPAELIVDSPTLVAIGAQNEQAAERRHLVPFFDVPAAQDDVGAPPRHVRRDGDGSHAAGAGDDARFERVLLRVQNLTRDRAGCQRRAELLGFADGGRADENRSARAMDARDFADDRGMLGLAGDEHQIRLVDAAARPMRRKDSRFESEERGKLGGRSFGRRGHAGEARVEPHEVLHRDRAEHAAFGAHRNSFLGLDRRLNAVRPSPVLGDPSRPLVDDFDPSVAHDIVAIAAEEHLGVQGDVDGAEQQVIRRIVESRRRGAHRRGRSQARS